MWRPNNDAEVERRRAGVQLAGRVRDMQRGHAAGHGALRVGDYDGKLRLVVGEVDCTGRIGGGGRTINGRAVSLPLVAERRSPDGNDAERRCVTGDNGGASRLYGNRGRQARHDGLILICARIPYREAARPRDSQPVGTERGARNRAVRAQIQSRANARSSGRGRLETVRDGITLSRGRRVFIVTLFETSGPQSDHTASYRPALSRTTLLWAWATDRRCTNCFRCSGL